MRLVLGLLLSAALFATSLAPNPPGLAIPRFKVAPSMERSEDLSTWEGAAKVTDFGMIMPDDKGQNRWPTTAYLAWGPDALYVAVNAQDPEPAKVRSFRHKRDDFTGDQDYVGLDLDPSGHGITGIRLLVNPTGDQSDAIFQDNSGEDYTYDCLWESVGLLTARGYLVKFRVPYSSLRRMPGEWGLRLIRVMPRERRFGIAWPRMSRDIQCDMCQMARVTGAPVENPGSPFLVVPFVTGARTQTTETNPAARPTTSGQLGLDMRYATTSTTFEGTYRPDFNNVDADVDPLQIDSRFNVLYPERRPFFLEGMDLLGITGAQRQFYSRSILDPQYGIKASGSESKISWSVLNAKDENGGSVLDANNPSGLISAATGLPTRDTVAGVRLRLDGMGSGFTALGTDKQLLGGPESSGGQSGGVYWNQHIGSEFQVIVSGVTASAHLPEPDGSVQLYQGKATSGEVDWNNRNWYAWAVENATSPDLVLVSGFTDLQGYRRTSVGVGWHESWNEGSLTRIGFRLSGRDLLYWDGNGMDRAVTMQGNVETAGRWSTNFSWDIAGRTWANDEITSNATRSFTFNTQWQQLTWFQPFVSFGRSRTIDLDSGAPARSQWSGFGAGGNLSGFAYNVQAQQSEVDREADNLRFVRAREVVCNLTWQFPWHLYFHTQAFVVRYDGTEEYSADKFIKIFLGWQPNAFANSYVGWSGKRRWDPVNGFPDEMMVDRGIFAKLTYAMQF
jgi:Domain of unknown function (DUF5916)